jgi:hypothetical protein
VIIEYSGFNIKADGMGLYTISNVGKGVLAGVLRGSYTSPSFAKHAIDDYLNTKVNKDAKTNSGS